MEEALSPKDYSFPFLYFECSKLKWSTVLLVASSGLQRQTKVFYNTTSIFGFYLTISLFSYLKMGVPFFFTKRPPFLKKDEFKSWKMSLQIRHNSLSERVLCI